MANHSEGRIDFCEAERAYVAKVAAEANKGKRELRALQGSDDEEDDDEEEEQEEAPVARGDRLWLSKEGRARWQARAACDGM